MHSHALLCLFMTVSLSIWEMTASLKSEVYGQREDLDTLIYQTHAKNDYTVLTDTIQFPGDQPPQGSITMINVTDLYEDGNGGSAILVDGGVGHNDATFSVTCQRNHGYDFIFRVYGFPKFAD